MTTNHSLQLNRAHKLLMLLFLLPGVYPMAFAQLRQVNHASQQWVQYYTTTRFSEKGNFQADVSYRWKDGFDTRNQYLIRFGATYKLLESLQLGGGIAHLGTYGTDGLSRVEFRPYQDLGYKTEFSRFDITNRIRLEERILNPVVDGKIQSSNTFNFRFRYSLSVSIPLFGLSDQVPDRKLLLLAGDEIFLNTGKRTEANIFDQNRIQLSPTLQWNRRLSIALTWSYAYASTQEPSTYLQTDVFWLQIRQQFDLLRKNKNL